MSGDMFENMRMARKATFAPAPPKTSTLSAPRIPKTKRINPDKLINLMQGFDPKEHPSVKNVLKQLQQFGKKAEIAELCSIINDNWKKVTD